MIHLSISIYGPEVNGQHQVLAEHVAYEVDAPLLTLDRPLLGNLAGIADHNQIQGCIVSVSQFRGELRVVDIPFVTVKRFVGKTPQIEFFKASGCFQYCKLDGIVVGRADFERSNTMLVDSRANQLNIGMVAAHFQAQAQLPMADLAAVTVHITGSEVTTCRIFTPLERLETRQASIQNLVFEPSVTSCQECRVTERSVVARFRLDGAIGELAIENSEITDLSVSDGAKIGHLSITDSSITRPYNLRPQNVTNPSLDSWTMVQQSARASNDDEIYAMAGFHSMNLKYRRAKGWAKTGYFFIWLTCGYGYRPRCTLGWALGVILLCGLMFWLAASNDRNALKLPREKCAPETTNVELIGYSLYLSVITFTTTGYGDAYPNSLFTRTIAGCEAVTGILLLSLLVFALTTRYASLR
jgi:hypothetical protein